MSGMERARSATSPQAQCEGSVWHTPRPPSSPAKYDGQQQVPDEAGTKSLARRLPSLEEVTREERLWFSGGLIREQGRSS